MITLNGVELLKVANDALRKELWARPNMTLSQVEQKGSTLVFYGTGFTSHDNDLSLELLQNLDNLAQSLSQKYRLAE